MIVEHRRLKLIFNKEMLLNISKRKIFLVKQWKNKSCTKEGVVQTYLHWNFHRLSYSHLLNMYIMQLWEMSEHTFCAMCSYCQYKRAKTNLFPGCILLVHDFAQNYLCIHQNQPQALHWVHPQVTVHSPVAHYVCPRVNCDKLVTHEVVHVSDDLKHNAHLIKKFTQVTVDVFKRKKVKIYKIV